MTVSHPANGAVHFAGVIPERNEETRNDMNVEITPATFSLPIIARTKTAIYLRLPRELQRDTDGCSCDHCKLDPTLAKWDTLVVPIANGHNNGSAWTHTVHMPTASLGMFLEYVKRNGL
jgi:hypothetical protein